MRELGSVGVPLKDGHELVTQADLASDDLISQGDPGPVSATP
jgi:hypothetical protein